MRRLLTRFGYLIGVLSFLTWIFNSVAGGIVFPRADGLVIGEPGTVSPEYTVTVLEILVRNGQEVHKGDIVARVSSSRIAEIEATLSSNSSALVTKMAEINAKASMIDQLVSSAEARDTIVSNNSDELNRIKDKKLIPILTQNAVADQIFKGKQELAILRSEKESMSRQVAQVLAASRFTDQALDDIAILYDAGKMKAPMDGFIAGIEAGIGSVVLPGQIVAEMVGEQRYVLAYFPIDRFYDINEGKSVSIDIGIGNSLRGTVTRIMPIAAKLPKEFQRTLSPQERQQIVRVDFDKDQKVPPYFTKVTIR